ncbi:hypothetical protein [Sorangium sp. So ce131]|uniref:hypothetical protein n=1 Tax=Sorangium sp. So ce131 TaxID=3133282 RepID=UPI003F5FCFEA
MKLPGFGEGETAHHDQHLTLRDGRFITKHIYAGRTRVASTMDPAPCRSAPGAYGQAPYATLRLSRVPRIPGCLPAFARGAH